jgi:putative two-component system response regulator
MSRDTGTDAPQPRSALIGDGALPPAVASLGRAEMLRDLGTSSHARRSALIVHLTARELGMPAEKARAVAIASLLHDIGKIAVPIDLLQKSTPLTPEEHALIRTHCRRGHDILRSNVDPILALASEIALHHHECCDGSGYPDRLSGDDIPLAVQVSSICDGYDALRQDRPYRRGLSHADAMRILVEGDGRTLPQHFSTRVLAAFCRVSDKARTIFDAFDVKDHMLGVMA